MGWGVGQGGTGARSDFLNWTSAERKRIFFQFFQYFFDSTKFSRSISKREKKRKPTGALSADRKCVGAWSTDNKKGRSVERK